MPEGCAVNLLRQIIRRLPPYTLGNEARCCVADTVAVTGARGPTALHATHAQSGMMSTMKTVKEASDADLEHQLIDHCLSKDVRTALADSLIVRNVGPTPEASETLTWGKAPIDSLDFMKPERVVVRERAGWVRPWRRVIAK